MTSCVNFSFQSCPQGVVRKSEDLGDNSLLCGRNAGKSSGVEIALFIELSYKF